MSTMNNKIDVVDQNDLANGRYPHLRKLRLYDLELWSVLDWLNARTACGHPDFVTPKGLGREGDNLNLPTELHFNNTLAGDNPLKLDAALVFNFPHVALVELKHAYRLGDPNVIEMYPGVRSPIKTVKYSPVGEKWPEKGENAYRPSLLDDQPYDAVYEDETGSYRKDKRGWAFISYPVWVRL